jgi:2-iminobutanoate/2-iminopropanoate deaminase
MSGASTQHNTEEDLMAQRTVAAALMMMVIVGSISAGEDRSYVRPSLPDGSGPPFSGAVRVGDTLYLSGDIGLDENDKVPATAKAEAALLLDGIKATLQAAGYTMDDLVTVTVYCSDVRHYADFNEVYRTYFTKEFPARAFVGAGTLLFDARFELQAVAVKR